ncbi:MAG: TatD family hydrolase [Paludibacter sp.]
MPLSEVESFTKSHPDRYFSVGIHPWDVHNADPSTLHFIEKLLVNEKLKAIGECGFDRNAKASFKEQGYFFERQVLLSEKYEKPLIIHCVASFNEIILLRKRFNPTQNWILHGFRGKPEMASQLLKHGFALSYGVKYNPASVEITPIDQLCIETDIHFEIPIETIYREIATLKNCRIDELNAACRLLKLYVC